MHRQAVLFFYKFRLVWAGVGTIAFLILISALVTVIGANTVLNAKTRPSSNAASMPTLDDPNLMTDAASGLAANMEDAMFSAGSALYKTCRGVTAATTESAKSIAHSGADVVGGVWDVASFAGHGVGSSIMFTLRAPGKITHSLTDVHAVSDIIQPAAGTSKSVPVISNETSAAALASLDAAQQQEIAKLQAAQLVANRGLEGVTVTGDSDHGGYPAKWDDAPQDSMLDSWGMYNRECVSYTAWKVYQTYGDMPYWGGVGNANQWVGDAEHAGIPVSSTPRVHSVAISMRGYYGHAMWVEAVNGDMIYVSQYNYDLNGHYSEMWVNGSDFTYIYFH